MIADYDGAREERAIFFKTTAHNISKTEEMSFAHNLFVDSAALLYWFQVLHGRIPILVMFTNTRSLRVQQCSNFSKIHLLIIMIIAKVVIYIFAQSCSWGILGNKVSFLSLR